MQKSNKAIDLAPSAVTFGTRKSTPNNQPTSAHLASAKPISPNSAKTAKSANTPKAHPHNGET